MKRVLFIFILFLFFGVIQAQNPHSTRINDCASCHNAEGWTILSDTFHFNHDSTAFPLDGQHMQVDCRSCHISLVFQEASSDCISCHQDMHQLSVGNDCARCHQTSNWLVDDIPELHESNGFPLLGGHQGLSCVDCHQSETNLRFDRIGNDCISCHLADFQNTESPDHEALNFSMNCIDCHDPLAENWRSENINHDFFPLELGHDIADCKACHTTGNFSDASPTCISCHEMDFTNTVDPNHQALNFDQNCTACHTLDPGWQPAQFTEHDDLYFPIYSGEHKGEWNDCVDCHTTPSDYSQFTCITCHQNPETNDEHDGVVGYQYESSACLACHPTGNSDMAFDHDNTNFQLTGEHLTTDCIACHADGYAGTPTECVSCHAMDHSESVNPDHQTLNIPMDCAACHTTESDWMPATFDIHDDFYELVGAHVTIAEDCASCHQGDYTNTPNTCAGCHREEYDMTTDPDHAAAHFNTECLECHTQEAWLPSTYDHDNQHFPIYSGKHEGEWASCVDCHTNPDNFTEFSCIICHMNPDTDDEHDGVGGYVYEDNACLVCHPSGDADMPFDHDNTSFPLTGEHIGLDCILCHANGYAGTPTDCAACHALDYSSTVNPNHTALNIPMDCATCHTTEPEWMPATFDIHDNYYELNGAHAVISDNCTACHDGDYNNTPNTCIGCHQAEFDMTVDPDHVEANFSTNCLDCHTESMWTPSTFDHDFYPILGSHTSLNCIDCHSDGYDATPITCVGCHQTDYENTTIPNHMAAQFSTNCVECHDETNWIPAMFDHDGDHFPIYSGKHDGEWNECIDCHFNSSNYAEFTCIGCHMNPDTDDEHDGVGGYVYQDNACFACHPTGDADEAFDHDGTNFPLTGAHLMTDCLDCHSNGYTGTPTECTACHQTQFDESTNPDHTTLGLSTDCATCHTTEIDWTPATFDVHDSYYVLNGAHAVISNDCATCHNGDYVNTPNTCAGCHQADFDMTTDPNHVVSGFSNNCIECHSELAWEPATIDHSFYPLNGAHNPLDCIACHTDGYNNTPNTCIGCHQNDYNGTTNPDHGAVNFPTDCILCHDETAWVPSSFDHDNFYPLTGAHAAITDCDDCHNGIYTNTPNTCVGCHQTDFDQSLNPDHGTLGIPTDCATCHTTDPDWMHATFDIHDTYYPLVGAHAAVQNDCILCHNGDYNNTPNTCVGCHLDDFNGTVNPDHAAVNFPTDCILCHDESAWVPSSFDHDNFYPLTGAHAAITDCDDCHNGIYTNTPNTCVGCHQTDFDQSLNPDHGTLGIPTDCATCHTTDLDWMPATFDIHDNYYPLNGAHATIQNDCVLCHNGDYNNTPNTCVGCHQDDYDGATNPDHAAAMFPTDCATCHSEVAWTPSTFDHDGMYFPIYSGKHDGEWNECIDCHTTAGDFTTFSCIDCHEHDNQTVVDDIHDGVSGYSYTSAACFSCHPTGEQ